MQPGGPDIPQCNARSLTLFAINTWLVCSLLANIFVAVIFPFCKRVPLRYQMKVKVIARNPDDYVRETKLDIQRGK